MNQNETQPLFAYQKAELFAKQQEKHYRNLELKQAKKQWLEDWGYTKKSYRPQLFIKITADNIYITTECQQFENRIISYN